MTEITSGLVDQVFLIGTNCTKCAIYQKNPDLFSHKCSPFVIDIVFSFFLNKHCQ